MDKDEKKCIITLPKYSFFGDYQVMLDLYSNISYFARSELTICFKIKKKFFLNLLKQTP